MSAAKSKSSMPREPWRDYRLFEFDVDDAWVRKNNENLSEVRRLQISAGIIGFVFAAIAVGVLLYSGMEPWGYMVLIAFGIIALAMWSMILVIPRKMGSMSWTYETSELVPAIVAAIRPRGLTLLALVDRAVDRSTGDTAPALVARYVEKIPGLEKPKEGVRVAAVAVAGNRSVRRGDNRYEFISPLPIAWGTGDRKVWKAAQEAIPGNEWETLRQALDRLPEVEATRTNTLPLEK